MPHQCNMEVENVPASCCCIWKLSKGVRNVSRFVCLLIANKPSRSRLLHLLAALFRHLNVMLEVRNKGRISCSNTNDRGANAEGTLFCKMRSHSHLFMMPSIIYKVGLLATSVHYLKTFFRGMAKIQGQTDLDFDAHVNGSATSGLEVVNHSSQIHAIVYT